MKSLPLIFELKINDEDENKSGISLISFVEQPATDENFMYFNKENIVKNNFNKEKMLVTGPAMIPNKKIIRMDEDGDPYFVFFSEETIRKCQELFFKNSDHKTSKLEHEFGIENVTIISSWIIEDAKIDTAVALGFKNLPVGTWMVTFKIDNEKFWDEIKNKKVLGFSIEGEFLQEIYLNKIKKIENDIIINNMVNILNLDDLNYEEKFNKVREIFINLK